MPLGPELMLGICRLSVLVLHETLLVPVLMAVRQCYGRRRDLGTRRKDRILNAQIWELCRVKKDLDERIDEDMLCWLGHVERVESDMIAKRIYVGECAGSPSMGRLQKRWIDIVKECLRKRGLDVRQARRIMQSEWQR